MHASSRPNPPKRLGAIALSSALVVSVLGVLITASSPDRVFGLLSAIAYPEPEPTPRTDAPAHVRVRTDAPVAHVPRELLSFAVDSSQVVGGNWWSREAEVQWPKGASKAAPFDFARPELRRLTRELAPAYLRIGGTEADSIYYAEADEPTPPGYELRLERAQWDALVGFAKDTGTELVFTLNAGPGPRDADGAWRPDNAARLIQRAGTEGAPVAVWELGNEVNAFWITHGVFGAVSPEQYGHDVAALRAVSREHTPAARLAGPGVVLWPKLGEPPPRRFDAFAYATAAQLDILTWHYYPQQSRRCPIATRRSGPESLLEPFVLDEVDTWASYVESARDANAPGAALWLGETGGAQCGGEPGVSDRFASSLWWLDQLGRLAARDQQVVVRQTLAGSHYGMIDAETLAPRPDYFASVLFKQLMGEDVLAVERPDANPFVRAYAHCTPASAGAPEGAVTTLLVNVQRDAAARVEFGATLGTSDVFQVTADSPSAERVELNGAPLTSADVGHLLERAEARERTSELTLAPLSYAFVVQRDAAAAACLSR